MTPQTVAHQAPLSMGLPRQEHTQEWVAIFPPEKYSEVSILERVCVCVCVTFLGNQASADIFKLRWVLLDRSGPWSSAWGLIRREKSGPRCTGARPCDNAGRAVVTLPQAKDRQGPLHHHRWEKATQGAPKKAQPCWYLDLSLLSSRAVRGYTSAVLSPPAAVLCYGNLQTRTPLYKSGHHLPLAYHVKRVK